ncbi:MAG: hypothetical protein HZC54_07235 [Verrucomicrobia bacterium]|nr:hypothetical protein [Verrucomicrobiota bacterium]
MKDTANRSVGAQSGTRMVVKVRWLKPYEGAQNHICIGEVLAETPQCLKVLGRTYHFRKPQGNVRAVQTSAIKVRWIPWNRIEVVTELHPDTDWRNLQLKVDNNNRVSVTGSVAHGELVAD